MASFFRNQIAQKVLSLLLGNSSFNRRKNAISSLIKVSRLKGKHPQLVLPWEKVSSLNFVQNENINIKDVLTKLRNQGLPTAEGFIDIAVETSEDSPTSLVFTVDRHVFSKLVLMDICVNENNMAKSSCLFRDIPHQNVVVNCSSPAIGKVFHLSHFRCAIHSNFIANINRFVGHDVVTVCHVNDWGLAAAALVVGFEEFGMRGELEKNPILHLSEVMKASLLQYNSQLDYKDKVDQCAKKLQRGDENILSVWNFVRNSCVEQYKNIYDRIGLSIDELHFDSCFTEEINTLSNMIVKKDFINIENDGTVTVNIPEESRPDHFSGTFSHSPDSAVFLFGRKLAEMICTRNKHNFDTAYYISLWEEKDLSASVTYLLNDLGHNWTKNIKHVKLKEVAYSNTKTKIRNSIDDILNKSKTYMLSKLGEELNLEIDINMEIVAETLGMSSLYINDMKHRRNRIYTFDWEDMLHFGKDAGTSFQFCYAGLKGLQKDSEFKYEFDIDTSPLCEHQALNLVRHLARFDEMVYRAYMHQEPCLIFQYLSTLHYLTEKAAHVLKLDLKSDRLRAIKARLLLLKATLIVLEKGLNILGIQPLESIETDHKDNYCETN